MLKIKDLTRLAEALSGIELIQEIDQLKAEVDSHRPISKEIQDRIFQKFRLDWNYNSNAIEGNKLTYGETVALLMHDIVAKGKTHKDHLDIKGHNEGIDFLLDLVKSERNFSQSDIRTIHQLILVKSYKSPVKTNEGVKGVKEIRVGEYKTKPNSVETKTGEIHYYASPAETPALMNELMDWYEAAKKNDKIHPFITASLFHHRFVSIHPFDDGNGRMTRLLMNLILMRNQYPLIVVPMKLREEYYGILSQADVNEFEPMIEYFGELLKHSLNIQLKGIKGEDISEPDDIDKEITLFIKGFSERDKYKKRKTLDTLNNVLFSSVIPLLQTYINKGKKIGTLFIDSNDTIKILSTSLTESALVSKGQRINSETNFKNLPTKLEQNSEFIIESLTFIYHWYGFKKSDSPFNISDSLTIRFNDYDFSVYLGHSVLLSKLYHEKLGNKEINEIIGDRIKIVLESIKNKS